MARVALASSPWRTHATPALTGGMGSRLARVRRASAPCPPPHGRGRRATPDNNFLTWCEENFKRGLLKEYVDPDKGPTEVMRGSGYKALWKCAECDHEWRAVMHSRTRRNRPSGCAVCSKRLPKSEAYFFLEWCEENGERGERLSREYADPDVKPTELAYGSNYKALWKCATCDHEWRAVMHHRTSLGGCPACSRQVASSTNNFLAWCEENGEQGKTLLEEYVDPDRKPTEVTRASSYKALWKCAACDHEWRTTMNHRSKSDRPTGCPACNRARRTAYSQSGRRVPPAATR